jgi:TDG/mug DNA glycosylase family protein
MPSHSIVDAVRRDSESTPSEPTPWRPTKAQLQAARDKRVPDLIAPNLKVLFSGINPGLYSAAVGHHFARPGNRFWPTLHAAGFTPRVYSPFEERELLKLGYGITNLVDRATAAADELGKDEFVAGKKRLVAKVKKFSPRVLAVVGVGAYRAAFGHPHARVGLQDEMIGETHVWVLPNPSGLNAHYQRDHLADVFRELNGWLRNASNRDRSTARDTSRDTRRARSRSV